MESAFNKWVFYINIVSLPLISMDRSVPLDYCRDSVWHSVHANDSQIAPQFKIYSLNTGPEYHIAARLHLLISLLTWLSGMALCWSIPSLFLLGPYFGGNSSFPSIFFYFESLFNFQYFLLDVLFIRFAHAHRFFSLLSLSLSCFDNFWMSPREWIGVHAGCEQNSEGEMNCTRV